MQFQKLVGAQIKYMNKLSAPIKGRSTRGWQGKESAHLLHGVHAAFIKEETLEMDLEGGYNCSR